MNNKRTENFINNQHLHYALRNINIKQYHYHVPAAKKMPDSIKIIKHHKDNLQQTNSQLQPQHQSS